MKYITPSNFIWLMLILTVTAWLTFSVRDVYDREVNSKKCSDLGGTYLISDSVCLDVKHIDLK